MRSIRKGSRRNGAFRPSRAHTRRTYGWSGRGGDHAHRDTSGPDRRRHQRSGSSGRVGAPRDVGGESPPHARAGSRDPRVRSTPQEPGRHIPPITEVIGYLGAALAVAAGVALVGPRWDEIGHLTRLVGAAGYRRADPGGGLAAPEERRARDRAPGRRPVDVVRGGGRRVRRLAPVRSPGRARTRRTGPGSWSVRPWRSARDSFSPFGRAHRSRWRCTEERSARSEVAWPGRQRPAGPGRTPTSGGSAWPCSRCRLCGSSRVRPGGSGRRTPPC